MFSLLVLLWYIHALCLYSKRAVTHEDERTAEDLFHRAYIAAWLLRVLKTSSYLPASVRTPDAPEIALSEGETLVADAILYHLQMLQFNSHEVRDIHSLYDSRNDECHY